MESSSQMELCLFVKPCRNLTTATTTSKHPQGLEVTAGSLHCCAPYPQCKPRMHKDKPWGTNWKNNVLTIKKKISVWINPSLEIKPFTWRRFSSVCSSSDEVHHLRPERDSAPPCGPTVSSSPCDLTPSHSSLMFGSLFFFFFFHWVTGVLGEAGTCGAVGLVGLVGFGVELL